MTERLVSDPYAIAFVNAMCDCKACVDRTSETYSVHGGCNNCGGLFTVVNRKGDRRPLSVECPHCEVNVYGWAAFGHG